MAILKIQPYIIDETQGFVFANVSTTGNITSAGNVIGSNFFYSNGTPVSGGGGGGTPGGSSGQIQFNSSGTFAGASFLNYISGNGQIIANANISSTSANTGTMVITGGLGISGNLIVGSGTAGNISGINFIFANSVVSSANISGHGLTLTGSLTAIGPGDFDGGLQSTPIGNATASTANLTSYTVTGLSYHNGNVITNNILPFGNANANIGSGALQFNTVFAKATSAQYADLAEIYKSDSNYEPGTVVIFGGEKEITVTNNSHDTRVAGVISTNPAYLMNSGATGLPVAFTGRVPCLVKGLVRKGDLLVTSDEYGVSQGINSAMYSPGCVFGKSLENKFSEGTELIEVAVGRY
jgi:hypothetical protein